MRVIDRNGVVCLQCEGLGLISTTKKNLKNGLEVLLEDTVVYDTIGGQILRLSAYYGEKKLLFRT